MAICQSSGLTQLKLIGYILWPGIQFHINFFRSLEWVIFDLGDLNESSFPVPGYVLLTFFLVSCCFLENHWKLHNYWKVHCAFSMLAFWSLGLVSMNLQVHLMRLNVHCQTLILYVKKKKKVNGWTYILGSIIINRAKHCDKLKRTGRTPWSLWKWSWEFR